MRRVLIGALRYSASLRRVEDFTPSSVSTILLVELTRLGDVVVLLPFLPYFQSCFPGAQIRVLVNEQYVSLFQSFETGAEFVGVREPQSVSGLLRGLAFARNISVDLAVSMSSPRRNVLATLASLSRFKLGYLSYVDSLTPFLLRTPIEGFGFEPSASTYARENIYERPAKIFEALGMNEIQGGSYPAFKQEVYNTVRSRLLEQGRCPEKQYVLLQPFSGWEFRNWGVTNFMALAKRIVGELGYDVVVSCETKDLEAVRQLPPGVPNASIVASRDLLEVAVLMKGASLVVANDSGPLHLAAALRVKTVGLFGPAPPELTAPLSARGTFLYKRVDCSPCDQRVCIRPDRPCMALLEPDEVFSAVASSLASPVAEGEVIANA